MWDNGARVLREPMSGGDHFCVSIPGKALDSLTWGEQVDLVRDLGVSELKATRLDVALDYKRSNVVDRFLEACKSKQLVGPRKFQSVIGETTKGEVVGATVYLGSRQSEACVRAYDKGLEQGDLEKGELERIEVEFKDHKAALLFQLMKSQKEIGSLLASVALSAFDFREDCEEKHLDRRKRASWWEAFVHGCEEVKLKATRVLSTIAGKVEWMARTVRPFLDKVSRGLLRECGLIVSPGEVFEVLCGGVSKAGGGGELSVREGVEWYLQEEEHRRLSAAAP